MLSRKSCSGGEEQGGKAAWYSRHNGVAMISSARGPPTMTMAPHGTDSKHEPRPALASRLGGVRCGGWWHHHHLRFTLHDVIHPSVSSVRLTAHER